MRLKTLRPWLLVALVASGDYWFPTVFGAVPMPAWTLLLAGGAVFGVWRWVAFFWPRRRAGEGGGDSERVQ